MDCPVCLKNIPASEIETHVEECLSLVNFESSASKRMFPFEQSSKDPLQKKPKIEITEKLTSNSPTIHKTTSIFRDKMTRNKSDHVPLAEKLRPVNLANYMGQQELLGPKTVLGKLLENKEIPSMILWGPPGCGKTSLANVIAKMSKENSQSQTKFVKLSATTSGIADIREAVRNAAQQQKLGNRTIVFMDEIHRFNKLQQDIFLPHVEVGTFTLIGATTENPSFSLNSALLSRCRVFVLEQLMKEDMISIIEKGIQALDGRIDKIREANSNNLPGRFLVDQAAVHWLAEACGGDARVALGGLEIAVKMKNFKEEKSKPWKLSIQDLKAGLEKSHTLADRKCDLNYDLLAAMQKSVRAGHENAALYWLARLMAGGEDPVYIARRLVRIASEDVGLADPEALDIAIHTMYACQMIGIPECDVMLSQCAVYLAKSTKSRSIEEALRKAQKTVMEHKGPQPSVPLHIRDRSGEGKLQASLGPAGRVNLVRKTNLGRNRLPPGMENIDFFN